MNYKDKGLRREEKREGRKKWGKERVRKVKKFGKERKKE